MVNLISTPLPKSEQIYKVRSRVPNSINFYHPTMLAVMPFANASSLLPN